jgi:hypothetical protein
MKKFLKTAFALCLIIPFVTVFTACGKKGGDDDKKTGGDDTTQTPPAADTTIASLLARLDVNGNWRVTYNGGIVEEWNGATKMLYKKGSDFEEYRIFGEDAWEDFYYSTNPETFVSQKRRSNAEEDTDPDGEWNYYVHENQEKIEYGFEMVKEIVGTYASKMKLENGVYSCSETGTTQETAEDGTPTGPEVATTVTVDVEVTTGGFKATMASIWSAAEDPENPRYNGEDTRWADYVFDVSTLTIDRLPAGASEAKQDYLENQSGGFEPINMTLESVRAALQFNGNWVVEFMGRIHEYNNGLIACYKTVDDQRIAIAYCLYEDQATTYKHVGLNELTNEWEYSERLNDESDEAGVWKSAASIDSLNDLFSGYIWRDDKQVFETYEWTEAEDGSLTLTLLAEQSGNQANRRMRLYFSPTGFTYYVHGYYNVTKGNELIEEAAYSGTLIFTLDAAQITAQQLPAEIQSLLQK